MAPALSAVETTAAMEAGGADLKFLFSKEGVSLGMQAKLFHSGIVSNAKLAAFAANEADLRAVLGGVELNLDSTASLANRVQVAAITVCFSTCKERAKEQAKVEGEMQAKLLTKPLPITEFAAMRATFRARFGPLEDKQTPARSYLELRVEELESGEMRAEALRAVLSRDHEAVDLLMPGFDKAGNYTLRRSQSNAEDPCDAEELRSRVTLMGTGLIIISLRHTNIPWLQNLTPAVFQTFLNYLLGEWVWQLVARDSGRVIQTPSWRLLLAYELAIRNRAYRQVGLGFGTFADCLAEACSDSVTLQRCFTTPLQLAGPLPPAFSNTGKEGDKKRKRAVAKDGEGKGRAHAKDGGKGGKGTPKGEKGDKAAAKGKRGLGPHGCHWTTPDGKGVCFDWNTPDGCKNKNRQFVECCGRCFSLKRPIFRCGGNAKLPETQGAGAGAELPQGQTVALRQPQFEEALTLTPTASALPTLLSSSSSSSRAVQGNCFKKKPHRGLVRKVHFEVDENIVSRSGKKEVVLLPRLAVPTPESKSALKKTTVPSKTAVSKQRTALYLFAGLERKSDVTSFLKKAHWQVEEKDILRSRAHDITKPAVAKRILASIEASKYDAVIISSPCDTFTRVKFANNFGPSPSRTLTHKRGFPWLPPLRAKPIRQANFLTDFSFECLKSQRRTRPGLCIMEFPEDLGAIAHGKWQGARPASIWQWPEFAELLADKSFATLGLRQSDFGTPYVKPTRFLLRLPVISPAPVFFGAPTFDGEGFYTGPIPKFTTSLTLARQAGETGFRTSGTAAWPPDMCQWLSNCILASVDDVDDVMGASSSASAPSAVAVVGTEANSGGEDLEVSAGAAPPEAAGHHPQEAGKLGPEASAGGAPLEAAGHRPQETGKLGPEASAGAAPPEAAAHHLQEAGKLGPAPAGAGWEEALPPHWVGGRGPPRSTSVLGKERPYHDGAGLTSPGRWDQEKRVFPEGSHWDILRDGLEALLLGLAGDGCPSKGEAWIQRLAARLCVGIKDDPFPFEWVEKGRDFLHEWLSTRCSDYADSRKAGDVSEGQPFLLNLLYHLLREMKDADFAVLKQYMTGVTLGVLKAMPRTPAVYEEQTKWRLEEDPFCAQELFASNYGTVEDHLTEVEANFVEEEKEGLMFRLSMKDFLARFGTNFAISALAVLVERGKGKTVMVDGVEMTLDKLRVLYDATHVTRVNHRIRCRDKVRMPSVAEKLYLLRGFKAKRVFALAICGDVAKAHRRFKVAEEEQGYQACQLRGDTVWVNKVGTFGLVPCAYWWSRLLGCIVRAGYGLLGSSRPIEMLWYADGMEILGTNARERRSMVLMIFFMILFGLPFKNSKYRGGYQTEWIGLAVDYKTYSLGISAARAQWLIGWMSKALIDTKVNPRHMAGTLGRLGFTVAALMDEKPFLGPIYVWSSATLNSNRDRVTIPWAIRLIFIWLIRRLTGSGRMLEVRSAPAVEGILFRSDAKAEDTTAAIGGWECRRGADASQARWFFLRVDASWAPWAFAKKSDPKRVIAALELLGTILCVKLFCAEWGREFCGAGLISGSTDNLGNSFATQKLMSTKWPLTVLLMELSETLRVFDADLHLGWTRRDFNQEADDLSNEKFGGFNPSRRIPIEGHAIPWLVLPEMMEASHALYEEICAERGTAKSRTSSGPKRAKAGSKLRDTDPWQPFLVFIFASHDCDLYQHLCIERLQVGLLALDSPPDSDRNSWGSGSPTHSAASLSPGGCNGVLRGAPPPVSLVSAPPLPPPQIQQGSGVGHASGQTVSLKGLGDLVAHASPLSSRGVPGASPRWGVSQTMGSLPSPSGLIDNPAQIWQDITSLGEEFDVEAWCKHARESGRHQGEQIAELAGVILRLQKAVLFLANNARGQGSAGPASIGGSRTSMASVASAGGVGTGSERLRWSRSQGLPGPPAGSLRVEGPSAVRSGSPRVASSASKPGLGVVRHMPVAGSAQLHSQSFGPGGLSAGSPRHT
ncbi:unnamed protein product, partial [Polarella glacialis]